MSTKRNKIRFFIKSQKLGFGFFFINLVKLFKKTSFSIFQRIYLSEIWIGKSNVFLQKFKLKAKT